MSESRTATVLSGRYRLRKRLASGGMGTVWEATDRNLKRPVAVKLLNEALMDDERFIERFRREARAVAGLVHPNVAGVFDYGEDRGRPYIVMELIDGETLAQITARSGPQDPGEVARIGADAAVALAAAHEAGIVHRDVKPANIMVTRRGDVKVMDFGIAAEALAGGTGLTGTGMIMGTARYLSPEQAQGHPATPASDIYSLGAVLYELLAGRAPFEHDSPMATAMAHVNEVPAPFSEVRPDVPPSLAATVERCLAKDPADRSAQAASLAEELRGQVPTAGEPELAGVQGKAEDAPTAVLPMAEATDRLAVQPAARRPERPGRRGKILFALLGLAVLAAVVIGVVLTSNHSGKVGVPTFVGKPDRHAARLSQQLGLNPQFTSRHSAQPKGTVIHQIPHAGAQVLPGTDVILVVSSGPRAENPPATVPPAPSPGHHKSKRKGHGKGKGHGEGD